MTSAFQRSTILALLIATASTSAMSLAGCRGGAPERRYALQGQVISLQSSENEITIKHGAVTGLMDGMTMPFKVKDVTLLKDRVPGDLVSATLVIADTDAYLTDLKKTGHADLPAPAPSPSASSGFEALRIGDQIPSQTLVDQNGKTQDIASLRGKALAITFIYTRCPIPTFCPMMDRHFATIQQAVQADATLRGKVHLASVSFDPAFDTPDVLKAHAATLDANPAIWTFFTGERDAIDKFAARFGVSVERAQADPRDITHNLRTAVVGPDGRLVKVYAGFDWTPQQILQDLTASVASE